MIIDGIKVTEYRAVWLGKIERSNGFHYERSEGRTFNLQTNKTVLESTYLWMVEHHLVGVHVGSVSITEKGRKLLEKWHAKRKQESQTGHNGVRKASDRKSEGRKRGK